MPAHHLLLLLLLLHHLHSLLLLLLHHHPLLLLLLHRHPTALHHWLLTTSLHHPHLPLLLLHLHLLLLLHVRLVHPKVPKVCRTSPLWTARLLPHMQDQPGNEAQVLLLGLGSHEYLTLHVRCWLLCWIPTFPDCFFKFPDKATAKHFRLPLLGPLLAHVVHGESKQEQPIS